ncbi:hypothetical protein ACH5RR_029389 [Cinchona calisaya]|uniref:Uncharacterized protein n=1 Tax=Cinchona calisaya TaxID=153742 RepID=A0ABD2YWQ6_9GENT
MLRTVLTCKTNTYRTKTQLGETTRQLQGNSPSKQIVIISDSEDETNYEFDESDSPKAFNIRKGTSSESTENPTDNKAPTPHLPYYMIRDNTYGDNPPQQSQKRKRSPPEKLAKQTRKIEQAKNYSTQKYEKIMGALEHITDKLDYAKEELDSMDNKLDMLDRHLKKQEKECQLSALETRIQLLENAIKNMQLQQDIEAKEKQIETLNSTITPAQTRRKYIGKFLKVQPPLSCKKMLFQSPDDKFDDYLPASCPSTLISP